MTVGALFLKGPTKNFLPYLVECVKKITCCENLDEKQQSTPKYAWVTKKCGTEKT